MDTVRYFGIAMITNTSNITSTLPATNVHQRYILEKSVSEHNLTRYKREIFGGEVNRQSILSNIKPISQVKKTNNIEEENEFKNILSKGLIRRKKRKAEECISYINRLDCKKTKKHEECEIEQDDDIEQKNILYLTSNSGNDLTLLLPYFSIRDNYTQHHNIIFSDVEKAEKESATILLAVINNKCAGIGYYITIIGALEVNVPMKEFISSSHISRCLCSSDKYRYVWFTTEFSKKFTHVIKQCGPDACYPEIYFSKLDDVLKTFNYKEDATLKPNITTIYRFGVKETVGMETADPIVIDQQIILNRLSIWGTYVGFKNIFDILKKGYHNIDAVEFSWIFFISTLHWRKDWDTLANKQNIAIEEIMSIPSVSNDHRNIVTDTNEFEDNINQISSENHMKIWTAYAFFNRFRMAELIKQYKHISDRAYKISRIGSEINHTLTKLTSALYFVPTYATLKVVDLQTYAANIAPTDLKNTDQSMIIWRDKMIQHIKDEMSLDIVIDSLTKNMKPIIERNIILRVYRMSPKDSNMLYIVGPRDGRYKSFPVIDSPELFSQYIPTNIKRDNHPSLCDKISSRVASMCARLRVPVWSIQRGQTTIYKSCTPTTSKDPRGRSLSTIIREEMISPKDGCFYISEGINSIMHFTTIPLDIDDIKWGSKVVITPEDLKATAHDLVDNCKQFFLLGKNKEYLADMPLPDYYVMHSATDDPLAPVDKLGLHVVIRLNGGWALTAPAVVQMIEILKMRASRYKNTIGRYRGGGKECIDNLYDPRIYGRGRGGSDGIHCLRIPGHCKRNGSNRLVCIYRTDGKELYHPFPDQVFLAHAPWTFENGKDGYTGNVIKTFEGITQIDDYSICKKNMHKAIVESCNIRGSSNVHKMIDVFNTKNYIFCEDEGKKIINAIKNTWKNIKDDFITEVITNIGYSPMIRHMVDMLDIISTTCNTVVFVSPNHTDTISFCPIEKHRKKKINENNVILKIYASIDAKDLTIFRDLCYPCNGRERNSEPMNTRIPMLLHFGFLYKYKEMYKWAQNMNKGTNIYNTITLSCEDMGIRKTIRQNDDDEEDTIDDISYLDIRSINECPNYISDTHAIQRNQKTYINEIICDNKDGSGKFIKCLLYDTTEWLGYLYYMNINRGIIIYRAKADCNILSDAMSGNHMQSYGLQNIVIIIDSSKAQTSNTYEIRGNTLDAVFAALICCKETHADELYNILSPNEIDSIYDIYVKRDGGCIS